MIFITHHLLSIILALAGLSMASSPRMQKKHTTRGLFDQFQFLSAHNSVRIQHGANMLTWSAKLAEAAESWADSCQFTHTSGVLADGTAYGENMVAAAGELPIATAVEAFLSDQSSFTLDPPTYNHFSQVIWKGTTEVGCARRTQCGDVFDEDTTLVACFYGPPGNVVGQLADNIQL
nr:PR2 [Flammulina filiformis]